ncbi:MAG: AzlD domain-containing protein [Candidatus Puniceispirillum sp.]
MIDTMLADQGEVLYAWLAVGCAIAGTAVWRFAGVVLASRIPADSPLMGWINTMAYAMVSGVLMLILAHPTGVLATTDIEHRFFGLLVGLVVVFFTKRQIVTFLCGVARFANSVTNY